MLRKPIGRREFLTASGAALGGLSLATEKLLGSVSEHRGGRLLASFDCTKDYPPERYFSYGGTKVVESAAGRYREAVAKPQTRFGYRFPLEHVGRPHLAVIRYPDDKRRYMCIMDGTSYDLSTGVFTGYAQPLSGRMLELHQVFWPRWNDCSITFLTWGEGEPAAISGFEIYELDDLAPVPVPGDPGGGSRRELGIQYEDPCGSGASEGALNREEWLDRVITYARHTGQKLFVYPIAWYHGPQFPSQREPSDGFDGVVGRDRKRYCRWTTHPQDWYAHMLERFGQEGLEYQASLTLLRLGSLMQKMNIDLDSIKSGADTINNMLWNDQVQAGTQDWTPTYNARNYPKLLEYYARDASLKDFPWIYGEKTGQPYPGGPIFNPLHPVVQEAIVGFAAEIAARYARYPAFKGISFNMWHATMLWYASIHAGYDDYTVGLFEKETGITVPVNRKAADRFSKRYGFLTYTCRPAWVAWRCRKMRELYRRIRDAVAASRSDLRVTFTLWTECTIPALLGQNGAAQQLSARLRTVEMWREAGLDPALLRDEPGIELDLQLEPQRDRSCAGTAGASAPLERTTMYRDHDFLDQVTLEAMRELPRPGAFIFDSWVEAWGKYKWFACEPGDAQARELAVMDGKPAEGIFRDNAKYPPDGFWWDDQLRITSAFPAGVHFLEHYAHAVAEFDACRITRGGLFLDKAHGEAIRRFALAYRALPKKKFETAGRTTDPVAVRALLDDGKRYFYLVNREYYPIKVEVTFDRPPGILTDLAAQANLPGSQRWEVVLAPYELRSFAVKPEVSIAGFSAQPPAEIAAALKADAEQAVRELKDLRASGRFIPGMDEMQAGIESAMAEGRWAWLRRALASYVVRKARQAPAQPAMN